MFARIEVSTAAANHTRFCLLHAYPSITRRSLTDAEDALLSSCWVHFCCRHLRLAAAAATDLDCFVEIEFVGTSPRQVVGGKSGQSAKHDQDQPFGDGVYLGRWRQDSKLKPDQRRLVAVKVMQKNGRCGFRYHDGICTCCSARHICC